ncbi:hypothetical protein [Reinekea sp. G2M2-21]|uniref:hypothetical protein n=1 Tax=Reinekea sp. G2M2-21 TaxID=2788942 RepID=UPI0018A8E227|nr:hypothetical protein [Reinekea sp. G2M2-21]
MKNKIHSILAFAALTFSALFSVPVFAGESIKIDIVYLPHGPVLSVMRDIEKITRQFPDADVTTYSFDEKDGVALAASYGFRGHMPILVVVNGSYKHILEGTEVEFYNFPSDNSFAPMFKGSWSYSDLSLLLDELAAR